jgi:DNA-nicking Smr family endonuclease
MQKYGHNPAFKELMMEFSSFMGDHFNDVADKKAEEEEVKRKEEEQKRQKEMEEIKKDPVFNIIETDPYVKECLDDPEVKKILEHLRFQGGLDLHDVMREKP